MKVSKVQKCMYIFYGTPELKSWHSYTVPFALGRVIDIIYQMDQQKHQQPSEIYFLIMLWKGQDIFEEFSILTRFKTGKTKSWTWLEVVMLLCQNCKMISIILFLLLGDAKTEISERLNLVCKYLVGIFAVGAACNFGRVYLMRISGQRITANLRNKVTSTL